MPLSLGKRLSFGHVHSVAWAAACLAGLATLARAQASDPCLNVADSELKKVSIISTGLANPMELAIAPDNRIFIVERVSGKIKIYDPATKQTTTAGTVPVYATAPHTGLLGVAVDPGFAANHFVYVYYTHASLPQHELARFTEAGGALSDASKVIVLTVPGIRWADQHHSAGSLAFGPDGNLYISTGENVDPNVSQGYASTGTTRQDDTQATAANTNDLNGKILRIHPEADGTYTIPAGNLFPTPTAKEKGEIFAMGMRNPIRIALDSKTGWVYWCEPGPDATAASTTRGPLGRDEVNRAKVPGFFGWPYFNADNQAYIMNGVKQDPAHVVNHSTNNTGDTLLPPAQPTLLAYGDADAPAAVFANQDARAAVVGGLYRFDASLKSPNRLPPRYDGSLFIMDWARHWINEVTFKADGSVNQTAAFMASTKPNGPIDMAFGTAGDMFLLEYDANSLSQIQYTGACKMDGASALKYGITAPRKSARMQIPLEAFVGRRLSPEARALWAERLKAL